MIESILQSCKNGLDVLTIYLLFVGYTQKETAQLLSTTESTISRRIKRIKEGMIIQ